MWKRIDFDTVARKGLFRKATLEQRVNGEEATVRILLRRGVSSQEEQHMQRSPRQVQGRLVGLARNVRSRMLIEQGEARGHCGDG